MSMLAWVMMAIAIWHFTIFLPDRLVGGIVGAFFASVIGALAFGFVVNGFDVPGRSETDLIQAFVAVPGALLGLAVAYWMGLRDERRRAEEQG
jgi:uncharacterized membrane protein YeaQ/YmgE (transglycosylase-associated protein family)